MAFPAPHPPIQAGDHTAYMSYALSLAQFSPLRPTNFRIGALLLDADTNTVLSTGYSLELPGNTHAEQVCFMKIAQAHKFSLPDEEARIAEVLPENTVLYTTMEPCCERLSGNITCVERILRLGRWAQREGKGDGRGNGIKVVYVGIREPETFVKLNSGRVRLEEAGVSVVEVGDEGLERRIGEVATAGHEK